MVTKVWGFSVLAVCSIVDVYATLWTVNTLRKYPTIRKTMIGNNDPADIEINFIPKLLIKMQLPSIIYYLYPLTILVVVTALYPHDQMDTLLSFLLGAYFIIFWIHWNNYKTIKHG